MRIVPRLTVSRGAVPSTRVARVLEAASARRASTDTPAPSYVDDIPQNTFGGGPGLGDSTRDSARHVVFIRSTR
ncbi:MAG: hypothetical protein K2Y05_04085 [Hyphomicrobiaceae bacterium]|nr:hypothetical protein [Hyphomicrobiaceae bacterium]